MRREELHLADLIDNVRAVRGYLDGVARERWDVGGQAPQMALIGRAVILSASGKACGPV
jgi:drug/metabolite transporter superfamily protein YnfA